MDILATLNNSNFQRLAALIRVAASPQWAQAHPESAFGFHYNNFVIRAEQYHPDLQTDVMEAMAGMIQAVGEADPQLARYASPDVIAWFVGVLAGPHARTIIVLLLGIARAQETELSAAEAAIEADTSESYWRNQCAAGRVPGARKVGKTWLIPRSWVSLTAGKDYPADEIDA